MEFPKVNSSKDTQGVQSCQEFSPPAVKINRSLSGLKSLVFGLILPCGLSLSESLCAPGNLKGKMRIYICKHTCTYAYVCAHTHTYACYVHRYFYVHTFWRPQPFYLGSGLSWHLHGSPRQSGQLPCSKIPGPQRLKGRARATPETAEMHKKGLLLCLLLRVWYPCSESPTPLPCPQLVPKASPSILVNKDGLTKRKCSTLFLLCNHASLLSCHHRGDVVAGLWLPPTALWGSHRGQCLERIEEQ